MILRQILDTDPVVAASYLVGCGGKGLAAVVDPVGPVDRYVEVARHHGMAIGYVIDTHVHADHVSGGRALADAVGAAYVLGPESGATFGHLAVADMQELELGNVVLTCWHTPGHTPEHLTLVVSDRVRGPDAWCAFTGHTLMVGDMGRTELVTEADAGARGLFQSAERLRTLPDHVLVLPGAFSGSVCGRGLSGTPVSTIGFERRFNQAFSILEGDAFVQAMLQSTPAPPPNAPVIRAINLGALPDGAVRPLL